MVLDESRILVAETDTTLRRELYKALLDLDLFSDSAAEGNEALSRLKEHKYAVVLLDLTLPNVGAYELLDFIRTLPTTDQPIVLAIAPAGARQPVDHEIVQIVIRKPVRVVEVSEMVRSCVRGSKRRGHAPGDGGVDVMEVRLTPRR